MQALQLQHKSTSEKSTRSQLPTQHQMKQNEHYLRVSLFNCINGEFIINFRWHLMGFWAAPNRTASRRTVWNEQSNILCSFVYHT